MRPVSLLLGVPLLLALSASSAATRAPALADPVCMVVVAHPQAGREPPAWLLLAGAVVLLGAGRLAAS